MQKYKNLFAIVYKKESESGLFNKESNNSITTSLVHSLENLYHSLEHLHHSLEYLNHSLEYLYHSLEYLHHSLG